MLVDVRIATMFIRPRMAVTQNDNRYVTSIELNGPCPMPDSGLLRTILGQSCWQGGKGIGTGQGWK